MKKFLCVALTFLMMLSLIGCGPLQNILSQDSFDLPNLFGPVAGSADDTEDTSLVENDVEDEDNDISSNDYDDEDNDVSSNDYDEEDNDDETDDNNHSGNSNQSSGETIEETVLYDAKDVKITAKSLTLDDSYYAATIDITIENNSNKDLNISTTSVYVNGYQIDGWLYANISAGKKSNESLIFYEQDFERCGITTIADIELAFDAYDADTFDDYFETDLVKIETSAADGFEYEYDIDGTVIYDDNDVQILVYDFVPADPDNYKDAELQIYFYNGSDEKLYLSTDDTSVNGYMFFLYSSCHLDPGKHAIIPITVYNYELEENNIDEITDIELSFELRNYESYETIAEIGPVKITF